VTLNLSKATRDRLAAQDAAQAFPVTIAEVTGPLRSVILRGRSLPYRGVAWEGEQRVEIKWFPGSPVAQSQVLGNTLLQTQMEGIWKDAFLAHPDSRAVLTNFAPVGPAGTPGARVVGGQSFTSSGAVPGQLGYAERARVLRDAVDQIQRSGQLLRVEWGSMVRFGHLKRARFTHDREEDIAWELEFAWTGTALAAPKPRKPPVLVPNTLLQALAQALATLQTSLAKAQALAGNNPVSQGLATLTSLVTSYLAALEGLAKLAFLPTQVLGGLLQQLTQIRLAALSLAQTIRGIPAAYTAKGKGDSPAEVNLAQEAALAVLRNLLQLGLLSADQYAELSRLRQDGILGYAVVSAAETLRDLATRYYGTPNSWTQIASANGIKSSSPPAGTVVVIPQLPNA